MDGNGRWAKARSKARTAGHKEGLETAKKIVKAASNLGIKYVSLYVFSSENWKRAESEVGFLMQLIEKHLLAEFAFYKANNIRIRHIGNLQALPSRVQKAIKIAMEETAHFSGTTVILAINYGGQDEIFRAVKASCSDFLKKSFNNFLKDERLMAKDRSINPERLNAIWNDITQNALNSFSPGDFSQNLDTADIPPVDLLIRSGGEKRLSNFLLYQVAYAELYFSDKLWPDWTEEDLKVALAEYEHRDRRFGNA